MEIVSRPAGYPNLIFREGLPLKAGYVQMNDWSRLAVDLNQTRKTRGRKTELHQYKYALDKSRRGHVLSRKRELTNLRREEGEGQLRLSP